MSYYKNNTQENVLDYILANEGASANTFYLAMYTASPTESSEGTEVSGGSYARQSVTMSRTDQTISNDNQITFSEATADWGTVTAWALHSASSGTGNQVIWAPLSPSTEVNTGQTLIIDVNNIAQTFGDN